MVHGSTQRRLSAWRPAHQYLRSAVSAEQWDWLLDPGSLTRRLRQRCGGGFRVAVRSPRWGRPLPDERRLLGMAAPERALMREVHLLCGATPWVFARTVMPVSSLRGRQRRLTRLGNRPLGAALFADRSLRRGELGTALGVSFAGAAFVGERNFFAGAVAGRAIACRRTCASPPGQAISDRASAPVRVVDAPRSADRQSAAAVADVVGLVDRRRGSSR